MAYPLAIYGQPEPGKKARTARTALGVGGAAAGLIGATIGMAVGGPVGAIVGGVLGLIGLGATTAAGLIDPERAGIVEALTARGLSRPFALEYAKSQDLDTASLLARAGELHDRAARRQSGSVDALMAVRQILAERRVGETERQAQAFLAIPRTGTLPLWAPAGLLAIGLVALTAMMARKRGR